jgi:hypothetical protein
MKLQKLFFSFNYQLKKTEGKNFLNQNGSIVWVLPKATCTIPTILKPSAMLKPLKRKRAYLAATLTT